MKHLDDNKTIELFLPVKARRGRPSTGVALSPADRQKAYRARLLAAGESSLTVALPLDLLDALDKFVTFKSETKSEVVARILKSYLLRKR